jgi:translation elongation factor EF-1alpha
MAEKEAGTITHYYGHINVGIIQLSDNLKVGDNVHIKGHSTDFTQQINSIQIEHKDFSEANAGDIIGVKVNQKVHPHDKVFKVTP